MLLFVPLFFLGLSLRLEQPESRCSINWLLGPQKGTGGFPTWEAMGLAGRHDAKPPGPLRPPANLAQRAQTPPSQFRVASLRG